MERWARQERADRNASEADQPERVRDLLKSGGSGGWPGRGTHQHEAATEGSVPQAAATRSQEAPSEEAPTDPAALPIGTAATRSKLRRGKSNHLQQSRG